MARKKAAQNCNLPYWASARTDCKEGRFIMLGNSLLLSEKFKTLNAGALKLYLCAMMESGGKPEFAFPASAAKKYGILPRSMRNQFKELIDNGLIEVVSSGRVTREKSVYRFSATWKNKTERPP